MINENEVRALIIKRSRRELLDLLRMVYPASLCYRDIRLATPTAIDRHLQVDLSYLCDKGFVKWVNKADNMEWMVKEFRITSDGVEIADYITNDPALGT